MSDINDKKIEKLNALFEMVNADFATPDDLIKLSEALLGVIMGEKARVDKLVADNKSEDSQEKKDMLDTLTAKLDEKEKNLKYLISELGRAYADNDEQISAKFSKEVQRLEKKIPSKIDLTQIYNDIQSLKDGINSFPTELTINNEAVRDGLELFDNEDDKLKISAIGYLQETLDRIASGIPKRILSPAQGLRFLVGGVKRGLLSSVNFVAGSGMTIAYSKVNGQDTLTFTSTGGGGGMNVETPTGTVNGTNVTFVFTVAPKFIVTDTGFYIAGFGYSMPVLTATMDLAPNTFIRGYS
jgi:hypothetical protein